MRRERFCPHCDIVVDLHDGYDEGDEQGCESAAHKERMLRMFNRMVGDVVGIPR